MNASSSVAACRPLTTPSGVSMTSTFPALISEMRSQRPASLMKWVETKIVTLSRRDSSIRCSQKPSRATGSTPEVGSSRISRVGPVDQRHGQLQALPLPQGERVGQRLHDLIEAEPRGRFFDALRDLVLGHVKELGVQDQVLPHRQLGVKREGLRHVADLAADGDVVGVDRLAEQPGLPLGGRQQAAQHLHRRRFAAAVGAEEAVDLPAARSES